MIKINTEVGQSEIHGLGLFTLEDIEEGALVWEPTIGLDIKLGEEEFEKLKKEEKEFFLHYGYKDKDDGQYYLNFDHSRFINHDEDGNLSVGEGGSNLIAKRKINVGEELTENYSEFEMASF